VKIYLRGICHLSSVTAEDPNTREPHHAPPWAGPPGQSRVVSPGAAGGSTTAAERGVPVPQPVRRLHQSAAPARSPRGGPGLAGALLLVAALAGCSTCPEALDHARAQLVITTAITEAADTPAAARPLAEVMRQAWEAQADLLEAGAE